MDRTERLYKIQKLLQTKRFVHISEFLRLLEVSRATFRRDLEYLRDRLGAPIIWDRDRNGYSLQQSTDGAELSNLPGLWFTEKEVHALMTMMQLVHDLDPASLITPQINAIQERLMNILDSGCDDAREMAQRVRILPMARRSVDDEIFQLIAGALVRRKRIEIRHLNRQSNQETVRQISPQQAVYYRDNWYLDAFCHQKDDIRCFSIDAIVSAKELDKPAVSLQREAIQVAFESSYGIFAGEGHQVATLRFSPFRARWVAKEVWHPHQRAKFNSDGSYILEVPYGDDRELILDILRQGPDCEVLEPPSLRTAIAKRLEKSLSIYKK